MDASVLVALRLGTLVAVEIWIAVCVGATTGVTVEVGNTGAAVAVCEGAMDAVGLGGTEVGGSESGQPGIFGGKLAGSPPGGKT